MARAFVISLIGGQKTNGKRDERGRYADLVYEQIIAPAFVVLRSDFEIEAIRGDQARDNPGILDRILDSLLEDDLIIALLSEPDASAYNPNVFFELGAARAIGRPVLMLKRIEQAVPFDIHGEQFITYTNKDLKNPALARGPNGPATLLARDARQLLESGTTHVKPFKREDFYGRLGARDRFMSVSFKQLSSMLLDAEREIWFAGTSLYQIVKPGNASFYLPQANGDLRQGFPLRELLAFQIARGVDVNIVLFDPRHPMLDHLELETRHQTADAIRAKADALRQHVRVAMEEWKGIGQAIMEGLGDASARPDAPLGAMRITPVLRGAILDRVCMTEKRLFFTPNMHFTDINSGPCVEARAGTGWYEWVHKNLEHLADLNSEASIVYGAAQAVEASASPRTAI